MKNMDIIKSILKNNMECENVLVVKLLIVSRENFVKLFGKLSLNYK